MATLLLLGGLAPVPRTSSPVEYEMKSLVRREEGCADPDPEGCAHVSLSYPVILSAPTDLARAAIEDAVRELALGRFLGEGQAESPEELARDFLDSYAKAGLELPPDAYLGTWVLERKVEVIRNDERAFSLSSSETSYTGGAHPNSFERLRSLDPATGRRLSLEDVLVPGFERRLARIAEVRFRATRDVPAGRSLEEAGFWFEGDIFRLNDNFAVSDSGLVFHYDPYEIAPYAFGPTDLLLTRADLGDLVRRDGPLGGP